MKTGTQAVTFCRLCGGGCSIAVTVEKGKLQRVQAGPESTLRRGAPCVKGLALPDILNHPDRLRYPLRRTGAKGEGKWARVSWDEALTTIADKFNGFKREFGPETVVLGLGNPKGIELAFAQRFASAFGTPNVCTPGHICHMPGELASLYTFGSSCLADSEHHPACVVVWGSDPSQTHSGSLSGAQLHAALDNGAKLVVIDPRRTSLASRASLWLRLKTGSDGALALGMLKYVVNEMLYDEAFVANWTLGFDLLRDHLKGYSWDWVEKRTGVDRGLIEAAARLYAHTRPATIQWGNALDHNINSFQTCRAISILRAITGNIDIPGGDLLPRRLSTMRPGEFMLLRNSARRSDRIMAGEFKLAARSAFIPRQSVVRAILEDKPYPVKALWLIGSNPLLSYSDAKETYQALMKVGFLVVSDLSMTPSAELADIVLPAATCLEFDEIAPYPALAGYILAYPQVADPPGECWPDAKMINELAKKMGLGEQFWPDFREALDLILNPAGLSFEQFKEKKVLQADKRYRKYEKDGFGTPSKKVEIYSQQLKDMGYSPLPIYSEPEKAPETAREYPLILTSAKESSFVHSGQRNISRLRQKHPEPVLWLNPHTASRLGLKAGDWAFIETNKGRIKQRLALDENLDAETAVVAFGWWFPEKGIGDLYGWSHSNVNVLTDNGPPYEPALGSLALRGLPCKVYKA